MNFNRTQMNLSEYASFDGLGLAKLVTSREVSAKELAHLLLHAVERVSPQLNCVLETYAERADAIDGLVMETRRLWPPGKADAAAHYAEP